ncbi:hypothetical protein BDZ89DRAFT_1064103 [Hymenopellis radicata]|nr:hypothetical protein BDZ89DRAFT_1064103 [Hymenopellis radicata]
MSDQCRFRILDAIVYAPYLPFQVEIMIMGSRKFYRRPSSFSACHHPSPTLGYLWDPDI